MVHRPSFLPALRGVVTGLVLTGVVLGGSPAVATSPEPPGPGPALDAAPGARAAAKQTRKAVPEDEYDAPLDITIDELTPGALPRRGPLVVRGTVTNVDLDSWQGISLYPMLNGAHCTGCGGVMTTAAELENAAKSDPESPVGERICTSSSISACSGVVRTIASLAPGETASYTLRVPQAVLRSELPSPAAGVYWFGVHASGESASTPRDDFADGRARTFLPYVPAGSDKVVDTAVVVPLRGPIAHTADGRLARTPGWERSLSLDGNLGGALAFGSASGIDPVTWLVDPALPDAVRHLARGNVPREIEVVRQEPSEEPSPTSDESDTEGDAGAAAEDGAEPTGEGPLARAADSWLRQAEAVLGSDHVATLPYGDPDVAAAATSLPDLYATAREHPGGVLSAWNVAGTPVVAPSTGYLDQAGIESVSDGAVVLLGDQMFPAETFKDGPPATGMVGDRPVVVSSSGAAEGGPGPDSRLSPVALRQRVLSEAVVRLLRSGTDDGDPEPLVVMLPTGVDATGAATFWDGLDVSWLRLTDLDSVADRADRVTGGETAEDRQIDPAALDYPQAQELLEVDSGVLVELDRLVRSSRSLQSILGDQYRIAGQLLDEALAGASYSLRTDPQAGARLARTRGWVEGQLGQLSVDAPSGVTLSGTSGSFNVAVRNTLDYPVSVRIEATTDQGAEIGVANPIVLAANSRSSVPIEADMTGAGVHNVTLRLTDLDGNSIGAEDQLPIRSGQVGVVIWAIIGAGVGILFVAIGIRLVRRFRAHRHRGAADDAAADDARSPETEDAGAP